MTNVHPSYSSTSLASQVNGNRFKKSADDVLRTNILLLGLRRSGKTSIQQVLFNDVAPKQAFYMEQTMRITKHTFDSVIPFEIWDCPGNITAETLGVPLSHFDSIIFVIDILDSYLHAIPKLVQFIVAAFQARPDINFEVFVHKAEALSEDYKIESFRQIQQRVIDDLLDISLDYEQVPLMFHLTSVYDHSLHESFSRVLLRLIDSLPYLEELLNVFCANSQSSKAFLFDIKSRVYVATDSSPVDSATHNLCCDYVQMLNSFGPLFKSEGSIRPELPPSTSTPPLPPTASPPPTSSPTPSSPAPTTSPPSPAFIAPQKALFYPSASTALSPSGPGTTLTYHLITPSLALLALLPTATYQHRRGLVEYNVVFFREGVREICDVERERRVRR